MVRNPGGSKVEDELYEKKGKWDETEPEEEEDGLREEARQYQYHCGCHMFAKVARTNKKLFFVLFSFCTKLFNS